MIGLFNSILLMDMYRAKLRNLGDTLRPSAKKIGATECQRCGLCCWQRPCSWDKEALERLAALKGIIPAEAFKKYFVVDSVNGTDLYLFPIRKSQQRFAGEYLPSDETYCIDTPCIFLAEENVCECHDIKSRVTVEMGCWKDEPSERFMAVMDRSYLLSLGWDGCMGDEEDWDDEDWDDE